MPQQYKRDQGGKFSHQNLLSGARSMHYRFQHDQATTKDKVEVAGAAVGAVAGVKGGSYARGAYKLSRLSTERAGQMSHLLNHATPPRKNLFDYQTSPLKIVSGAHVRDRNKIVRGLQKEGKPYGDVRHASKGADYWADTFQGMKHSRDAVAGKVGPRDVLNFNKRPQARYLNRIVENSGKSEHDLYRGMHMDHRLKVGEEIDLPGQTSWSSNREIADRFTSYQPKSASEALKHGMAQARGEGPAGHATVLKLPKGNRATSIEGLTKTLQNEHLTPGGRYRVKEINQEGHHVMERVGKNYRVSAFGVVH